MSDFSTSADKIAADAKRAAGSAWSGAAETAASARDVATGALRDGTARVFNAGSDAAGAASGHIRDYPLSSALLFLGAGFIAGYLIPRGR